MEHSSKPIALPGSFTIRSPRLDYFMNNQGRAGVDGGGFPNQAPRFKLIRAIVAHHYPAEEAFLPL
jgi:hypothetical protein